MRESRQSGATRERRTDGGRNSLTLSEFLVVVLICKHVTCSSPDLPPLLSFSSSPPPSAVEVELEDAMNTCKHPSYSKLIGYGNRDDATCRRLVALFGSGLVPYLPFLA